jgi:hypothetical protein
MLTVDISTLWRNQSVSFKAFPKINVCFSHVSIHAYLINALNP